MQMKTSTPMGGEMLALPAASAVRHKIWLLLALLVYALAFQGSRGLFSPDEGRYVNVGLNMFANHDWLHPRLNDETFHYTKPPMTYWALAASFAIFGQNEWGARIPNAIFLFFTTILVYQIARCVWPRLALLSAVIYAASPFVYVSANIVTTDTLLTMWEMLGVWAFLRWWQANHARAVRRWNLLMWLAFALAFMTKGPPGLLPLLPIVVWMWTERNPARRVRTLFHPLSMILFLIVALSWYIALIIDNHKMLSYFLYDEVYERIFSGKHGRNPEWYGGFKQFSLPILFGAFPWVLPLLARLPHYAKNRQWYWADRWTRFVWLWFALPMVVFMLAKSKLPLYVVPLMPPICIASARVLGSQHQWLKRLRWMLPLWIFVLISIRMVGANVKMQQDSRLLSHEIKKFGNFEEVVFLDTSPIYGLRMYMESDIEEVTMTPRGRKGLQNLQEELLENERDALFVAKANDLDELSRALALLPYAHKELGHYREWHFILLHAKHDYLAATAPTY